jgi:hypothetical protein
MAEVAFKSPGAMAMTFPGGMMEIDVWISTQLSKEAWDGWYCYNDILKGKAVNEYFGRCKGIVLWNSSKTGWMIHSVPQWPVESPLEPVPACELPKAHSFCFWVGAKDRLPKIEAQIDLMGAKVYLGTRSVLCRQHGIATLQRIILDKHTDHIAKNKHWDRDLYESLGKCSVRSKASMDDTTIVNNIRGLPWSDDVDDSTWAIGDTWICVGDVSRTSSQSKRGGGGILVYDPKIVQSVKEFFSK